MVIYLEIMDELEIFHGAVDDFISQCSIQKWFINTSSSGWNFR